MELPSELLELIVSQGLDSCQTSVSWMHISPTFQKVVTGLLGVIVLQDGVRNLQDIYIPFDYRILMGKLNTLYVWADHSNSMELLEFIKSYMHLLIIVQSDRNYSDVLASLMATIAQYCNKGATICVIYNNLQNYLSKLYFRGMSLSEEKVIFSELHIVGDSTLHINQLFDIDTLFERTFLHHLKRIYSLDIQNKDHKLISQDLAVISQLNFGSFDEEWCDYFMGCPNLSKIENTKYPIRITNDPFKLPKCDAISLTHYVDGAHYQPLDGSQISGGLTIVPTLRSINPEFYNLHFANLKKLKLVLNDSESHLVRFHNCYFGSLRSLDCGSCLISWTDLTESGARLKHIKLSLSTDEQAKWLCKCPYQLERISITSCGIWSPASPNISRLPVKLMNCKSVDLDIQSIWHCYLCHTLVLPNINTTTHLKITLKEASLLQSILENSVSFEKWGISLENGCIILKVPSIKHFAISVTDKKRPSTGNNGTVNAFYDVGVSPFTGDYLNIFFDANTSNQNYAVSPSAFRRSSLAGVDSVTARRQSEISNLTSYVGHPNSLIGRRSSSKSSTMSGTSILKTCKFVLTGDCPETITVNLAALDASLISWEAVKTNRVMLLEVQVQNPHLDVHTLGDSVHPLSEEIIQVLKFPYHSSLPGMIIEKFRVIVNLGEFDLGIEPAQRVQFAADLQKYLAFRGHNLRVLTELAESCRVSVLLSF